MKTREASLVGLAVLLGACVQVLGLDEYVPATGGAGGGAGAGGVGGSGAGSSGPCSPEGAAFDVLAQSDLAGPVTSAELLVLPGGPGTAHVVAHAGGQLVARSVRAPTPGQGAIVEGTTATFSAPGPAVFRNGWGSGSDLGVYLLSAGQVHAVSLPVADGAASGSGTSLQPPTTCMGDGGPIVEAIAGGETGGGRRIYMTCNAGGTRTLRSWLVGGAVSDQDLGNERSSESAVALGFAYTGIGPQGQTFTDLLVTGRRDGPTFTRTPQILVGGGVAYPVTIDGQPVGALGLTVGAGTVGIVGFAERNPTQYPVQVFAIGVDGTGTASSPVGPPLQSSAERTNWSRVDAVEQESSIMAAATAVDGSRVFLHWFDYLRTAKHFGAPVATGGPQSFGASGVTHVSTGRALVAWTEGSDRVRAQIMSCQ